MWITNHTAKYLKFKSDSIPSLSMSASFRFRRLHSHGVRNLLRTQIPRPVPLREMLMPTDAILWVRIATAGPRVSGHFVLLTSGSQKHFLKRQKMRRKASGSRFGHRKDCTPSTAVRIKQKYPQIRPNPKGQPSIHHRKGLGHGQR